MKSLTLVCPQCGRKEVISVYPDLFRESGLAAFSFIHGDHIFTAYVDEHLFVRGAYIKPIFHVVENDSFFGDFLVLTRVIVGHKFRFAYIDYDKRIIDIRPIPDVIAHLAKFLDEFVNSNSRREISLEIGRIQILRDDSSAVGILMHSVGKSNKFLGWGQLILDVYRTAGLPDKHVLAKILHYVDNRFDKQPSQKDYERILEFYKEKQS